jgi:hypothetical protein
MSLERLAQAIVAIRPHNGFIRAQFIMYGWTAILTMKVGK